MQTSLVRCMMVALLVAAVTGCQSGMHWPHWGWWQSTNNVPDTSSVTRSASPQLPPLPSSQATPATTSVATNASPSYPSTSSIDAGGATPDRGGAMPTGYPTTPYPATPYAAVYADGQSASAAVPQDTAVPAASSPFTPQVQTGPYGVRTEGRSGATSASGATTPPTGSVAYDHAASSYRTADVRTGAATQPVTEPRPSTPYTGSVVGDRYAPSSSSASLSAPHAPPPVTTMAAPQEPLSVPNSIPGGSTTDPSGTTRPSALDGDACHRTIDDDRFGGGSATEMPVTDSRVAAPQLALDSPPASAAGALPAGDQRTIPPFGPQDTPSLPPANQQFAPAPSVSAPPTRPAKFRPGGTSDYLSYPGHAVQPPVVPNDSVPGLSIPARKASSPNSAVGPHYPPQTATGYSHTPAGGSLNAYPPTDVMLPANPTMPPAGSAVPPPTPPAF